MTSVTTVLDYLTEPELLNWFKNNSKAKCKAISDEALRVGSAVDALVQQDIKEGGYLLPEGDSPIENCMKGWEKFKVKYPIFTSIITEMQIELKDGDLIGHPDFVTHCGIADLKCSSGIRPKYWTQVCQYYRMKFGEKFPGSVSIIRLDKNAVDGAFETIEITDENFIRYEWQVFEAYRTAYFHAVKTREQLRLTLEETI